MTSLLIDSQKLNLNAIIENDVQSENKSIQNVCELPKNRQSKKEWSSKVSHQKLIWKVIK